MFISVYVKWDCACRDYRWQLSSNLMGRIVQWSIFIVSGFYSSYSLFVWHPLHLWIGTKSNLSVHKILSHQHTRSWAIYVQDHSHLCFPLIFNSSFVSWFSLLNFGRNIRLKPKFMMRFRFRQDRNRNWENGVRFRLNRNRISAFSRILAEYFSFVCSLISNTYNLN